MVYMKWEELLPSFRKANNQIYTNLHINIKTENYITRSVPKMLNYYIQK